MNGKRARILFRIRFEYNWKFLGDVAAGGSGENGGGKATNMYMIVLSPFVFTPPSSTAKGMNWLSGLPMAFVA